VGAGAETESRSEGWTAETETKGFSRPIGFREREREREREEDGAEERGQSFGRGRGACPCPPSSYYPCR